MPATRTSADRQPRAGRLNRIVIVEDDRATLAGWTELLADAGYDVVGAASFAEGRSALEPAPALLIVDVRLGAFNGLQLVIRMRSERPDIPLIVVTGYADEGVRTAADTWGAFYLEKPVDPMRLLATVAEALDSAAQPHGGPHPGRTPRESERRRWPRQGRVRVVVATAPAIESAPTWHPSLVEDGDVIVARESANVTLPADLTTSTTSQFRLSVRGLPYMPPRLFARYDQAILHGEAMAAERSVRLFYVDTGILLLLKDHRPTRTIN